MPVEDVFVRHSRGRTEYVVTAGIHVTDCWQILSSLSLAYAQGCVCCRVTHLLLCVMSRNAASHFLLLDREDSEDIFSFCVKMAVGEIHTYEEHHEIQLQHVRQVGGYVKRERSGVGAKRLKIRQ